MDLAASYTVKFKITVFNTRPINLSKKHAPPPPPPLRDFLQNQIRNENCVIVVKTY